MGQTVALWYVYSFSFVVPNLKSVDFSPGQSGPLLAFCGLTIFEFRKFRNSSFSLRCWLRGVSAFENSNSRWQIAPLHNFITWFCDFDKIRFFQCIECFAPHPPPLAEVLHVIFGSWCCVVWIIVLPYGSVSLDFCYVALCSCMYLFCFVRMVRVSVLIVFNSHPIIIQRIRYKFVLICGGTERKHWSKKLPGNLEPLRKRRGVGCETLYAMKTDVCQTSRNHKIKWCNDIMFHREFELSNADTSWYGQRIGKLEFRIFENSKISSHEMWKVNRAVPGENQPISNLGPRNWSSTRIMRPLFVIWHPLNIWFSDFRKWCLTLSTSVRAEDGCETILPNIIQQYLRDLYKRRAQTDAQTNQAFMASTFRNSVEKIDILFKLKIDHQGQVDAISEHLDPPKNTGPPRSPTYSSDSWSV